MCIEASTKAAVDLTRATRSQDHRVGNEVEINQAGRGNLKERTALELADRALRNLFEDSKF